MELKGFYQGIISSASEYDIPFESASESLNVDSVASNGMLQGIESDEQLSEHDLKTITSLNDNGNNTVVGWGADDQIYVNTNIDPTSTSNVFTQLSSNPESVSNEPQAFKFSKNVIFATGKEETNEVLFVGKDKHKRWGGEPGETYFTEPAELKNGSVVDSFTKVIKVSSTLIGCNRGGTKLYAMLKDVQWKVSLVSDSLSTDHTIESIAPLSDSTDFIWVLMKKTSDSTFKILKVAASDFSTSTDKVISSWNRHSVGDQSWVAETTNFPTSIADIIEHSGQLFITEKLTNSTSWLSYLWVTQSLTASVYNFYDITPYHDFHSNPIGSWKLSELSSVISVDQKKIQNDDDDEIAFSVLDETNDTPTLFKFCTDESSSSLQVASYAYSYDGDDKVVSGDFQSAFDVEMLDDTSIGSAYTFFRTDSGMNLGNSRNAYSDSLDNSSPAIVIPEYKTIVTVLNPKAGNNVNPLLLLINYLGDGTIQNAFTYEVDSEDLAALTAAEQLKLRESPKLSYDAVNKVLFVGIRKVIAIPMYVNTSTGFSNDWLYLTPSSEWVRLGTGFVDAQSSSVSTNKHALIQTSLFNTYLNQWQGIVLGWTGGSTVFKKRYVAIDVTYASATYSGNAIKTPTLTYNSTASELYSTVSSSSYTRQMAQLHKDSPNVVERDNGSGIQLMYRQCTQNSRGTAVELKSSTVETQSTYLSGFTLPFVVDKEKGLLFALDKKSGTSPTIVRMYELAGTTTMTLDEIATTNATVVESDGTGYQNMHAPSSRKNTLLLCEAKTINTSIQGRWDFFDYSYTNHPITIGDGSLMKTLSSDWFLVGIEFDSDTYYKYGSASSDTLKTRASLVYIKWSDANGDNLTTDDEEDDVNALVRDKNMLHNSSNVKHLMITDVATNINSFSTLVHNTDTDDIIAYSSKDSTGPSVSWAAILDASAINSGTATLSNVQSKALSQYSELTVCGFYEGNQYEIHLFEKETNGRWELMKINNSGYFLYQSIDTTLGNQVQIITTATAAASTNFPVNSFSRYKFTFVYDGFQESPLSDFVQIDLGSSPKKYTIETRIWEPNILSKRITHINIYRSENVISVAGSPDEDTWGYYRFVKQKELDSSWDLVSPTSGEEYRKFNFTDGGKMSATYESITGVDEDIKTFNIKFSIGHMYNGSLFVADAKIKSLEDESTYIFKSQVNRPQVFDYSKDFLVLPETVNALGSYGNRVFAFSDGAVYRIEPNNMILEHIYEGSGALSQRSIVSVDEGLFYADKNGIYHQAGPVPQRISLPIEKGMTYSYDSKSDDVPILAWDPKRSSLLVFLKKSGSTVHFCLTYNLPRKRWDVVSIDTAGVVRGSTMQFDGDVYYTDGYKMYNFASSSTKRAWSWVSKKLEAGQPELDKKFHYIAKTGTADITYSTNDTDYTNAQFSGTNGVSKVPTASKISKFIKIKLDGSGTENCDSIGITFEKKRVGSGLSANSTLGSFGGGGGGGGGG